MGIVQAGRDWGTGLKRGDKMICLRLYGSKAEADAHLSGDHADADKLDPTTWFDTPIVFRYKSGAKITAILETGKAKRMMKGGDGNAEICTDERRTERSCSTMTADTVLDHG